METLFLSLVVVAIVKLVDLLVARDYASALKIVLAGIVGALAGDFQVQGLTVITGIQSGLIASGLIATAKAAR